MPDTIRITGGSIGLHRRRSGYCAAIASGVCSIAAASGPVLAQGARSAVSPAEVVTLGAYVSAISQLDRHEIAGLALTLGILCFAVVTAILLVRTRRRLAETEAAAHGESIAAKAAIDRFKALILAEPQVLIAWAAAADEPEVIGDPALVIGGEPPHHV